MKRIGERLLYLRTERKLSQADLAKLLDVSRPTITHWEAGTKQPSRASIENISTKLDVSADWLLGKIDVDYTKEENMLISDIHWSQDKLREKYDFGDLTDEEIEEAIEYIKFQRIKRQK